MINVKLSDGHGKRNQAKITNYGQLVTAPISFSEPYAVTVNATNTAFVMARPFSDKRFVVTDILLDADKNVSANTAGTVQLYEAAAAGDTAVYKNVLTVEMLKNTNRVITGLNLIVDEGYWLNIKTTDATIYATVLGYYV
jgi:hypothetical protein